MSTFAVHVNGSRRGIASGQVFVTAADVAMWLAIKTLRGLDDTSVTTHMQTEFLKSALKAASCEISR